MAWKKVLLEGDAASPSDNTPQPIGTTGAAGTGAACSRDDHVHVLGVGCINAANLFAAGVIDAAALGTDAVETAKIKDGNVTAVKLATDAVETIKIKDLNVTEGKLAAGAVTEGKLGDLAVATGKIAASAVTTAKISIDANLAMNKKEATGLALDNQAADPETPVSGQIYFKTGDKHPYLYQAA